MATRQGFMFKTWTTLGHIYFQMDQGSGIQDPDFTWDNKWRHKTVPKLLFKHKYTNKILAIKTLKCIHLDNTAYTL